MSAIQNSEMDNDVFMVLSAVKNGKNNIDTSKSNCGFHKDYEDVIQYCKEQGYLVPTNKWKVSKEGKAFIKSMVTTEEDNDA